MALSLATWESTIAHALQRACQECRWDEATFLLEAKCFDSFISDKVGSMLLHINALMYFCRQASGLTALHVAAENGGANVVAKMLGKEGFRRFVNAITFRGRNENWGTPLHAACKEDHVDIVEMLLLAGARQDIMDDVCFPLSAPPNTTNPLMQVEGLPMHWAAEYRCHRSLALLLRHGGNALVNKLRERQEVHFVDRSLQHAHTH
jgi:ankyrin repeat protein